MDIRDGSWDLHMSVEMLLLMFFVLCFRSEGFPIDKSTQTYSIDESILLIPRKNNLITIQDVSASIIQARRTLSRNIYCTKNDWVSHGQDFSAEVWVKPELEGKQGKIQIEDEVTETRSHSDARLSHQQQSMGAAGLLVLDQIQGWWFITKNCPFPGQ
ncbi:PREDICTED: uncharacterized protein LOC108662299 isoform X1 [Theobroma cacao]|uniref:Uncharacterized protein LOC108662299 isoform X1 n=1 Tax=Theobroma cacao TaxID=3641 RepID=A0AB32WDI3_THECC|nr:PREDICTED: uncharacterized protein LOC108662299 isoform X1 [Theobroma cacao]